MKEYVEPDQVLEEISGLTSDVSILRDNGFDTNRYSQDSKTNNYGYKLINFCKNLGIFIVNGRFGSDNYIGHNTCKNSSLVDYYIISTFC